MSEPTAEQPALAPTVSTAPARSRWSKLPSHLGRARTSTLVLGVLFLAIGTLYLNIRPEQPSASTALTSDTGTEQEPVPVVPTTPAPESTADPTTEAPEPTSSAPTTARTTSAAPTVTGSSTAPTTSAPPGTTGATGTSVPTVPSSAATSPTVVTPPG